MSTENRRLILHQETIVRLDDGALARIKGGQASHQRSCERSCDVAVPSCTWLCAGIEGDAAELELF
jgi:hypothetical protein